MATLAYALAMPAPETHLYEVTLRARGLTAGADGTIDLRMPAWTPGSYLIRDHARHVQDFTALDASGKALPWERVDKMTWRVRVGDRAAATVSYRVYANELSVRTSHLDATHGYVDGTSVFLYLDGALDAPATVTVKPPRGWIVDAGLPAVRGKRNTFRAEDYHHLADGTMEIGKHRRHAFTAAGKRHRVAIYGKGNEDEGAIVRDLERIVREEVAMMGVAPYDEYLFIIHLVDKPGGGLEHRDSNTSSVDRWTFQPAKKYEEFLALEAHEFFHVWNVKRMKPTAYVPYDYTKEAYTRLLWAMEGLTSYYDRLVLTRAGLSTEDRYRDYLADLVSKLRAQPGRFKLSLEESSLLTWVKLYKPDENWMNTGVSYYLKGELLGLALDLEIRARTRGRKSLDDVMRALYAAYGPRSAGIPEDAWKRTLEEVTGRSWTAYWRKHIAGTEELDLERAFARVGWQLAPHHAGDDTDAEKKGEYAGRGAWLGAALKDDHGKLVVKHVISGSPAEAAGLAAGDEILALDGYRAKDEEFVKTRLREKRPGDGLDVAFYRRDAFTTTRARLAESPPEKWKLKDAPRATAAAKKLRAAWLAPVAKGRVHRR